jgi:NAD(P)H-dependent flavin oxidoreductase YrpB (nitropropane dioxygenase family)
LPLVPAIVDAVSDTPVIAAGGIADGRGMAAALALGAAGVWVGTRFLASEEVSIHPEYQRRILAASENDTAYAKISLTVVGPTLHIGCCATVLFATGRRRVGHLRATDQVRARS